MANDSQSDHTSSPVASPENGISRGAPNPPCSPYGTRAAVSNEQNGRETTTVARAAIREPEGVDIVRQRRAVPHSIEDVSPAEAHPVAITLTLNEESLSLAFDARTTLLDLLRERLNLTGTKKGCDHGACGACTVHIDGKRSLACLTLAATLDGATVTTIEGLGDESTLHPMQEAFLRCDAYQCGYCTPGQILSAVACLDEGHTGSREEIREWMSGNLCRCAAYANIVAAIEQEAQGVENDPSEAVVVLSAAEAMAIEAP